MGQDSADDALYDFLYVDRAKVSALYAQLFPEGILTNVKKTAQQSFSNDNNIGSDIKVFKAEAKSSEGGQEGIEHMFDASWSIPLEVLDELKRRGLVTSSVRGKSLGSIVLTNGLLRVIDYNSMRELWEPAMQLFIEPQQQEQIPNFRDRFEHVIGMLRNMPHTLHAHFLTREAFLWSTLQPSNLTVSADDIILKYGAEVVSGDWQLLFTLDAYPDANPSTDATGWSAGEISNGVISMMNAVKSQIGRPSNWWGVTPLMIYRDVVDVKKSSQT